MVGIDAGALNTISSYFWSTGNVGITSVASHRDDACQRVEFNEHLADTALLWNVASITTMWEMALTSTVLATFSLTADSRQGIQYINTFYVAMCVFEKCSLNLGYSEKRATTMTSSH